jgi:transposase
VDPFPKAIDDLVPADHQVRAVWALVEGMDLSSLYQDIKAVEGQPGRTPIDLRILVALWLYATLEGVGSARELDDLCRRHDAYKWLCGGVSVNYHTLADFRTAHGAWLEEQIVASVALLRQEDLVDLQRVGQDGLRVRACAGSGSFKSAATLQTHGQEAQQQWDRLQAELTNPSPQRSRRQLKARQRAARERLERLQRAQEEWQKIEQARESRKKGDGVKARASTTDPDARKMKMPDGGYRPAFNVQFATDLDALVVVGVTVTNAGTDNGQMDPMVEHIEEQHHTLPDEYYTDGGFSTHADIEKVTQRGPTVYTPVKEEEKKRDRGQDPFAPQKGDSPAVAAWRQRMGTAAAQTKYKARPLCEWTNATCRNRGLTRFWVRGLEKVKVVALWYGLAVNVLRLLAVRAAAAAGTVRAAPATAGG